MSATATEVKKNGKKPRARKEQPVASKVDQARAIFERMEGKPRRDVVAAFTQDAKLTPSGASTYYQKFLNELKATGKVPASRTRGRPQDESSKAGMARALFKRMHGKSPRKEIIAQFVEKLHLTESGAATYYQTLKKAAA